MKKTCKVFCGTPTDTQESPQGRLLEARAESRRVNRSRQVMKAGRVFLAEVTAWAKARRLER